MADKDKLNKLVGYGQIALGIGFVLKGLADVGNNTPALLGKAPLALPRGNVIEKVTTKRVGNIDARVVEALKLVRSGSEHPAVRESALRILTKKCGDRWCGPEKIYRGEISAMFWAQRDPRSDDAMRYVRDHCTLDQFTAADKSQTLHAGDCDCGTILLGARLRSVGYPLKLRIMKAQGSKADWDHIFLLAGTPPTNPSRWVALDWSVESATPGWQAPGAEECAKTGKPAGMTEKVRDYDV